MNLLLLLTFLLLIPLILGFFATILFGKKNNSSTPALLFHSIRTSNQNNYSYFLRYRFEQLIETLAKQEWVSLRISDAILSKSDIVKKKHLYITFDDGFSSFYENAFPILVKHGFTATVFCVSGFIGKRSSWDLLADEYHMDQVQIKEVSESGFEIGSHSLTHACLPYLSEDDLKFELTESKNMLEAITGKTIRSLSFPFGNWNRRTWEIAKEVGFERATCYRKHTLAIENNLTPVVGVYSFDSIPDILDKLTSRPIYSAALCRATLMAQFAKGSPMWNFRDSYSLLRSKRFF